MWKRIKILSILCALMTMIILHGIDSPLVQASEIYSETPSNVHEGHNTHLEIYKAVYLGRKGYTALYCTDCNNELIETKELYPPEKLVLSKKYYTYTGQKIIPQVTVFDNNGGVIDSSHYVVTCKNNKKIGLASLTVKFVGDYYEGIISTKFSIAPKKLSGTSIKKVSALPSAFSLKWKKQKDIDGYQIQYSTNSQFKKARNIWVEGKKTDKNAVIDLKENKKYYVRMRTFKKIESENSKQGEINRIEVIKTMYSKWSNKKSVTTKSGKLENYSASESPFALYTIMYGDNKYPFYYGKWGGSANMDAKNLAKTNACGKKAFQMVRVLYADKKTVSAVEGWKSVGKYNGMNTVQRYISNVNF